MGLREHILKVLEERDRVRAGRPVPEAAGLGRAFERWEHELHNHQLVRAPATLYVKSGYGMGRIAAVPWIMVGDQRVWHNATRGVYVAYLGRPDASAMVLTIVHSIKELDRRFDGDTAGWDRAVSAAARKLHPSHQTLADRGFSFKPERPDLGPRPRMVKQYERAALAWKSYQRDALPANAELEGDLAAVLDAFTKYVHDEVPTTP